MDFRRHVDLGTHLLRDEGVLGHAEPEVAVLEDTLVVDQNVFQFDVHVRKLALIMHLTKALH